VVAFLIEYGLFLAKTVTFVAAILLIISGIVGAVSSLRERAKASDDEGGIRVSHLNESLESIKNNLLDSLLSDDARKGQAKERKREEKAKRKAAKKSKGLEPTTPQKPKLFVLDFDGDIRASAAENLRREISAILQVAKQGDEILVRLESPGGLVHSYGLAASQLKRITSAGLKLTVAVDKVAASGGYMMACIADKIVAAPFAVLGSIGVVAQVPNFHRLLKKHDVDVEVLTAGEYKRTLTVLGENTSEGRAKFIQELEDTHGLFKDFVRDNRRSLDLEKVATGEHWFGTQAKELGLVDDIQTSDELLLDACATADVYLVEWQQRQTLADRLGFAAEVAVQKTIDKWIQAATKPWWN